MAPKNIILGAITKTTGSFPLCLRGALTTQDTIMTSFVHLICDNRDMKADRNDGRLTEWITSQTSFFPENFVAVREKMQTLMV